MALDISSYWQPCALTPMGLVQFLADEIQLCATSRPSVDIEFGDTKAQPSHAGGTLLVTTHRLVWTKPTSHTTITALALALETVEHAEIKSALMSFGFAAPRVTIHLHDPNTVAFLRQQAAKATSATAAANTTAAVAPVKSSVPRYTRLAFRGDQPGPILSSIQSSLSAGAYRVQAAPPPIPPPPEEFKTTGAGIGGIIRDARTRERALDRTLEQAFGDLDALMANAKTIVDLAAKLATSSGDLSASATSDFEGMLNDMGIRNPVTHKMSGSSYHMQLAREMADFLPTRIAKEGGMMLLTDAYCIINRARGTQLISPQDCATAASLLTQLAPATTLCMREFDSGVKVIVADGAVQHATERIRTELESEATRLAQQVGVTFDPLADAPSLSPLDLSNRWHISIVLAKQYLCVAEQQQVLCRDESSHGLTFCINQF